MHILPAYPLPVETALPNSKTMLWLVTALALAAAPQVLNLPVWLTLFSLALGMWRLMIARRGWPLPPKWLYLLLALLSFGAVYVKFGTVFGRDAGVALLTVMVALKLLETRSQRDCAVLIFLGYFLCITNFLYTQSIPIAAYTFVAVWVLTAALVHLNQLAGLHLPRFNLRFAGKLLLQALPFMLVLFVLFPRVSGSLWALPHDARSARTGLSDEMMPGNIGSLAQSQAIAFRASFTSRLPEPDERYWRGPVLWSTDGRKWSAGQSGAAGAPPLVKVFGQPLNYAVTLEPHQKNWLFALDLPASVPAIGRITGDFQLRSSMPVENRVRYEVTSYSQYQTGVPSRTEFRRALQLPRSINPQTHALAKSWRVALREDAQIVTTALNYFRKQPFFYTLNPPQLNTGTRGNPVDEFLFDTRRGFCEHYAAAFTTLMRAAGIPARVVTGYQGGELNPLGDYLIVRQSDAHAWAEVWLKDRGWVRVDPTAAVAPERIQRGGEMLNDLAGSEGFFTSGQQGLFGQTLLQLRFGWDTVNYQWAQWVLGYGPARQNQLLANLGLGKLSYGSIVLALALGVALVLLFLLFTVYSLLSRRAPKDVTVALYQRFCTKLAKRGIVRAPSEGPQDFAARAAAHLPQRAAQIYLISQLYSALRYANRHPAQAVADLRNFVRAF
jgi:transglutaminase-like putative cysteine protease